MPWKEVSLMFQRLEFITMVFKPGTNMTELCKQYGISRKTGYKWLHRFINEDIHGLTDRSRQPHDSPNRTSCTMERAVLGIRENHSAWGGRKIRRRLVDKGYTAVPAASTITEIIRRYGMLDAEEAVKHVPFKRFEYEKPNQLWQMDFKGYFSLQNGHCHPLTILDDHSRFSIGLKACANEKRSTVKSHLIYVFRRYGLPEHFLMDNGPPWGAGGQSRYTKLSVWLIHLGINVIHSRPYHPQTMGKDERFHRTLKAEVLNHRKFDSIDNAQKEFDKWRYIYNLKRPHEALDMDVPASRYEPSKRMYPETLPDIEYSPGDQVRKVQEKGKISFKGKIFKVGKAFKKQLVAVRPTTKDGIYNVFFYHKKIKQIDLRYS
ncbi:MAG: Integrase core domain protein [Candidatus Scalindua rubra]|uniref:Integrase core domain protein n=1 Tax=Candidatus Scalindua rubra TaxID=1872076 RepID=A0A1E3X2A5_9BACT|nr:MAG: Integrase core domain protein [Candidatus Scalindua rubra]